MTFPTALALQLRLSAKEFIEGGLRWHQFNEAADAIDSLSQRLAAAEREREEARAEIDRLVLCYSDLMHSHDHWKSQATEQASSAERRNAELTKHVEDRENCCRQLLDTYAARQHELEQENAELARRVADDIRAQGWAVAIHNDYTQAGVAHTFWLFTKNDRNVKGEGVDDATALDEVRASLASQEPPTS